MALLTKTNPITTLDAIVAEYTTPDLISKDQFLGLTSAIRTVCVDLPESAPLLAEINDVIERFKNDLVISKMKFFTWYLDLRAMVKTLNG